MNNRVEEKDYYAILGVPQSATEEEIKQAYRALARRYHPDSRTEAVPTTLFHDVQAAYSVLSNPVRRRAYDRRLAEMGIGKQAAIIWNIQTSQTQLSSLYESQVFYVLVEVRPAATDAGERLPLNLCLVIDNSTSMKGARLEHVKRAAHQIIDELGDKDVLGVVTFNDRAEVIIPAQPLINRIHAKARVSGIIAGGGTEILQGLQAGLAEVAKHHRRQVISHIILLTDGQTYGDEEDCLAVARLAGSQKIGISAMGIGEDWNDELLDRIAAQSGGVSAYIAAPGQIRNLLQQRVRGLGAVFAGGVELTLRCADGVQVENVFRALPHLERLPIENNTVSLGTLQSDTPLSVVLEIGVEQKPPGEHRLLQLELTAEIPSLDNRRERIRRDITLPFVDGKPAPQPVPAAILGALSKITIYRMQEHAWKALDRGRVKEATRQLERIATRLFDLGETQLARAAMLEAGRVARSGGPTSKGRKELKYGTRGLTVAPRWRPYD